MCWQVDEDLDELISRIRLEEGNTEFWKRRFLGEGLNHDHVRPIDTAELEVPDEVDDVDAVEDARKEVDDDEADEADEADEEEEVGQAESQDGDTLVKAKEVEAKKPPQMIGVQLFKDSDQATTTLKKSRRRASRIQVEVLKVLYHLHAVFLFTSSMQYHHIFFVFCARLLNF